MENFDDDISEYKWRAIKGEWQDEPDIYGWVDEETGYPCLAIRNLKLGHWCGYVGVDIDHPFFEKGLDSWNDFDKCNYFKNDIYDYHHRHKNISYAERFSPHNSLYRYRANWWLGFACRVSYFDISPYDLLWENETLKDKTYKNLDYVKQECRLLAAQLKRECEK